MAKGVVLACALVVLAMAHMMPDPANAITCLDVDLALKPCIPYLICSAADPSPACCQGVQHIKDSCTTTPARQTACSCLKAAAAQLPGIKASAVTTLPDKCNVPLPYPVSSSVDCSKIQ